MTTFNTGNPVGSSSPRDLYDNSENVDVWATSTDKLTHPDRLGVSRKTLHGMQQEFEQFLGASGYVFLDVEYGPGIEFTSYSQVISAGGEFWRLSASRSLPYTTTGAGMPEEGAFLSIGDAALRQELGSEEGSSLVGFTQDGAGSVRRTLESKARESVSLKDFGAVGDGASDDTDALQAALNAASVGVKLFVPAGRYLYSQNLNAYGKLLIEGAGAQASVLLAAGSSIFVYDGGDNSTEFNNNQLVIDSLGFRTKDNHSSAVLQAQFHGGSGGTYKTVRLENIEVVTDNQTTANFNTGILLYNCRNANLNNIRILGRRGAYVSQVGVRIYGPDDPVEIFLHQVQTFFVDTGIKVSGSVEGLTITDCTSVAVHTGIDLDFAGGGEPLVQINGGHINSDRFGIKGLNTFQGFISNVLLYFQSSGQGVSAYAGIELVGDASVHLDYQIKDCTLFAMSGGTRNGIVLNGNPQFVSNAQIGGNKFIGFEAAIVLLSGSRGVLVSDDNSFRDCGQLVVNQGSANIVALRDFTNGVFSTTSNNGTITKYGSSVVTLDSAGNGTIVFPKAFPVAYRAGLVCSGDPNTVGGAANFSVLHGQSSAEGLAIAVRPSPGAVSLRVNWQAIGE